MDKKFKILSGFLIISLIWMAGAANAESCVEKHGLENDTVIFFHSNGCPACQSMVPIVRELETEGYIFHWAEVSDSSATEVVGDCASSLLTGYIPQFICVAKNWQHTGTASKHYLRLIAQYCGQAPDLTVSEIYLPEYLKSGGNITINAEIKNLMEIDTYDAQIEFLIDNVSVENKTIDISRNSEKNVTFNWTAQTGEHIITIRIDLVTTAYEFNKNNNDKNKTIIVEIPRLEVVKNMSQHDVGPGSGPMTTIIIQNPTYIPIYNLTLIDFLPEGFDYMNGTAMLNGNSIPDPYITKLNEQENQTLTWNLSIVGNLSEIHGKTMIVLTFKTIVKSIFEYNIEIVNGTLNITALEESSINFNNTVIVSGIDDSGEAVEQVSSEYELNYYQYFNEKIFRQGSKSNASCYEYIDYTIVIWNRDEYHSLFPSILEDELPPYLEYVPGYNYVNNTKIVDNLSVGNITRTCPGRAPGCYNLTELSGFICTNDETLGQTLVWNLSGMIYLAPGQQAAIKYRVRVIPGINNTAIDMVFLSYPDTQGVCGDCYFEINTTGTIHSTCSVKPDFAITNLSVPQTTNEGDTITITATIRNLQNINLNLSNLNVSLFVGGDLINSGILNLTNITEFYVNFTYENATFGINNIILVIDPLNMVDESSETNNFAEASLRVCSDLNHDGVIITDWNDLMNAYKCLLGVERNCSRISYAERNNMKKEYDCFVGGN